MIKGTEFKLMLTLALLLQNYVFCRLVTLLDCSVFMFLISLLLFFIFSF